MTTRTAKLVPYPLAHGEPRPWRALLRLMGLTAALSGIAAAVLALVVLDRLSGVSAPPPQTATVPAPPPAPAAASRRDAGMPGADNEFFGREASTDEAAGSY